MIDKSRLEYLEELRAAASGGECEFDIENCGLSLRAGFGLVGAGGIHIEVSANGDAEARWGIAEANARYVAEAWNAVPELIVALREAQSEIARLELELQECSRIYGESVTILHDALSGPEATPVYDLTGLTPPVWAKKLPLKFPDCEN